jgi:hypothetical protein
MLLNELQEPLDSKYCLVALCRLLMSSSPVEAEYAWDKLGLMASSPDRWFEVRRGTIVQYQRGAETVRSSASQPSGVAREDIGRIVEPLFPPTALRDYLTWLADAMPEQGMRLKARARSTAIQGMDIAFERKELATFLTGAAKPGFAESFAESLRRRYVRFAIPGSLAGRLLLLVSIAEAGQGLPALSKALRMPGRLNVLDAVAFTDDMLRKIARLDAGTAWIATASAQMKEQAGTLQEQAMGARTDGEFYGDVFLSAPPAYAAYFGFEYLAGMKTNPDRERHRRLLALCHERTAAATAALMTHFLDSIDGRQILLHRTGIARIRESEGEAAASLAAEQYLDVERLYPPFYRPFLLGESDILATAASAPRAPVAPPESAAAAAAPAVADAGPRPQPAAPALAGPMTPEPPVEDESALFVPMRTAPAPPAHASLFVAAVLAASRQKAAEAAAMAPPEAAPAVASAPVASAPAVGVPARAVEAQPEPPLSPAAARRLARLAGRTRFGARPASAAPEPPPAPGSAADIARGFTVRKPPPERPVDANPITLPTEDLGV